MIFFELITLVGLIEVINTSAKPIAMRWWVHEESVSLAYMPMTDQFISRGSHEGWAEVGIPVWGY